MQLPTFFSVSGVTIVFGVVLGILSTGCPAPTCPQCTIKKAQFTIPSAEGTIVDVVMKSEGDFTGHCDGERDSDGCQLSDEQSLGVLPENVRQEEHLPWQTDDDDQVTVRIEVMRQTSRGTTVQVPAPVVTIVR
jgi:hypothetical protein